MGQSLVNVTDLIADIRVMSGLRNNQLFSDVQIIELVNDAGDELYDEVEGAFESYFVKQFPFTLTGTSNVVTLPNDFKRDNSLTRNPTAPNPETVDVLGSWLERNQLANTWVPCGRRYFLLGNQLEVLPANTAAGDYLLYYTPFFQIVAASASTRAYNTGGSGSYVAASRTLNVTGGGVPPGFTNDDIGSTITVVDNGGNPQMTGTYVIATIVSTTSVTLVAGPPADVSSGLDMGGQIIGAVGGAPITLPQAMTPWALYLKVHASIAIRSSRQQDCADLKEKLQTLKTRIAKSVKNRTQAPRQAPLTRHGRWGNGRGFLW